MNETKSATPTSGISLERAVRLNKLITLLDGATRNRDVLLKKLGLDVRSFYRDIAYLRELGIEVEAEDAKYKLETKVDVARSKLPLPDPGLTVEEAKQLTKGTTTGHLKMRQILEFLQVSTNGKK
jgi:predicted DNA-binding transcriptional regulator YafY